MADANQCWVQGHVFDCMSNYDAQSAKFLSWDNLISDGWNQPQHSFAMEVPIDLTSFVSLIQTMIPLRKLMSLNIIVKPEEFY